MNSVLIYILIATITDSLLGLVGKLFFWIKDKWLDKLLIYFIAFSAGALLGGAFFHLLPEGLELMGSMKVFMLATVGFLSFLVIEGYFHWHQCEKCETHPFSYMMLIGDGVHNLIDGLIIAATFITDIRLGMVTTAMIIIHEFPQELGLFGSLIYAGHNKNKAMLYSFFAQSTVILGGLIGYLISAQTEALSGLLIAFSAGGFLYIAASDLIPEVHKAYKGDIKKSISLISILLFGIVIMIGLKYFGE